MNDKVKEATNQIVNKELSVCEKQGKHMFLSSVKYKGTVRIDLYKCALCINFRSTEEYKERGDSL